MFHALGAGFGPGWVFRVSPQAQTHSSIPIVGECPRRTEVEHSIEQMAADRRIIVNIVCDHSLVSRCQMLLVSAILQQIAPVEFANNPVSQQPPRQAPLAPPFQQLSHASPQVVRAAVTSKSLFQNAGNLFSRRTADSSKL